MGLIDFDDKMSVNIKHIDEQHMQLINILDRLSDAMKAGSGKEILDEVLTDLSAYVEYHFKTEEDLFNKYNFPDSKKHIEEHKSYIENIGKFNEKFNLNKTLGLSIEILKYLVSWIKHHIMEVDKKYSEFFIEKGVR
jgi:hemerythrin-like metal-binding protein